MSLIIAEIGADKQTLEASLNSIHSQLKSYTNDQITITDDLISIIESYYKTEKYAHEKMQNSLQKSYEHAQGMSYLGPSVIGVAWTRSIKEYLEHYSQRESSYLVLKQIVLENLKKLRNEKADEFSKILLYDDEIIKEMIDLERRAIKSKRAYDEACERVRQHLNPAKEKESGIKRLHHKILPKIELERLEIVVVDTRNIYILYIKQLNYALKFYLEQYIIDLDKLLVCDLFLRIEQVLDEIIYIGHKHLRDTLQHPIQAAAQDKDEQKRRFLPKNVEAYPLILSSDHNDRINADEKHLPQLVSTYMTAQNDVRDTEQQIQVALDTSMLNSQQNKDSRLDSGKIRLKRMEMRKSIALFLIEILESLVPNIKTMSPNNRTSSKLIGGLKPFLSSVKSEPIPSPAIEINVLSTATEYETIPDNDNVTGTFPCQAIVLYDFVGTNDDEMTVRKDEKIFIESKLEEQGWLLARGREGTGLVPESYVQLIPPIVNVPETGGIKSSIFGNKKDKQLSKNKKPTVETIATIIPTKPIDDDADYFSDD